MERSVSRGRLAATAGLGGMLACSATGAPAPEPTAPTTPVLVAAPTEEPETAKAEPDDDPQKRSPSAGPCWRHRGSRPFEGFQFLFMSGSADIPSHIELCPETCQAVRATPDVEISIEFPCGALVP